MPARPLAARRTGRTLSGKMPQTVKSIRSAQQPDYLREGAARARLLTNPRSPFSYRVSGIVRNVDACYTAFGEEPGDALYRAPADRVHFW
jgi:hypothetical protein